MNFVVSALFLWFTDKFIYCVPTLTVIVYCIYRKFQNSGAKAKRHLNKQEIRYKIKGTCDLRIKDSVPPILTKNDKNVEFHNFFFLIQK